MLARNGVCSQFILACPVSVDGSNLGGSLVGLFTFQRINLLEIYIPEKSNLAWTNFERVHIPLFHSELPPSIHASHHGSPLEQMLSRLGQFIHVLSELSLCSGGMNWILLLAPQNKCSSKCGCAEESPYG